MSGPTIGKFTFPQFDAVLQAARKPNTPGGNSEGDGTTVSRTEFRRVFQAGLADLESAFPTLLALYRDHLGVPKCSLLADEDCTPQRAEELVVALGDLKARLDAVNQSCLDPNAVADLVEYVGHVEARLSEARQSFFDISADKAAQAARSQKEPPQKGLQLQKPKAGG